MGGPTSKWREGRGGDLLVSGGSKGEGMGLLIRGIEGRREGTEREGEVNSPQT